MRVFEAWKLGQKGKDNGVLVVVVPDDRRMRIEVGYGLEGTLTDARAGRIIRERDDARVQVRPTTTAASPTAWPRSSRTLGRPRRAAPTSGASGSAQSAFDAFEEDLPPWPMRILLGAFIFGIIGLFTFIGVMTPGMGWFLYVFLIPFWAMFPIIILGVKGALVLLAVYVVGFPIAKLVVAQPPVVREGGARDEGEGQHDDRRHGHHVRRQQLLGGLVRRRLLGRRRQLRRRRSVRQLVTRPSFRRCARLRQSSPPRAATASAGS